MPLAGSMDVGPLLADAPTVRLDEGSLQLEEVEILQVIYELGASDVGALLPPARNPTVPPVVNVLAYRAAESPFGPFSLVQVRVIARAAVRPRAFLVSARCDNPAAGESLAGSWGYRVAPASIAMHRFHDRIECEVVAERRPILAVALVDPEPITGHDIQYAPGMHLAHVSGEGGSRPRLVQVETEYEFHRADRGRPELATFDPSAWGDARLVPVEPVSASFTTCAVTVTPVRYLCNPDLPAAEGTEHIGAS
jgi:hypothetical protein